MLAPAPKAPVLPPKPVPVPPAGLPKRFVPGVVPVAVAPKAGLAAPKMPPPVLAVVLPPPKGEAVWVLETPKPPKPVVFPAVDVLPPNKLPPVEAGVAPKADVWLVVFAGVDPKPESWVLC